MHCDNLRIILALQPFMNPDSRSPNAISTAHFSARLVEETEAHVLIGLLLFLLLLLSGGGSLSTTGSGTTSRSSSGSTAGGDVGELGGTLSDQLL